MAMRDVRNRDGGATVPSSCRVGLAHTLRIFGILGLVSVANDAVRFYPPIFAGQAPSFANSNGRAWHIPLLIISWGVSLVICTLLGGFWFRRLIESIELHFLGER